jgi:hypothetical protein
MEQAVKVLLAEVAVSVSVSDWHKVKELAEAVVKLQPENETALKFISLASDHIGVKPELADKPISSSEPIIKQVQKALNAYDQAKAEALVQAYIADNPTDSDGLKAQNIVLEHRQRDRRRRSDQRLGFNTRASTQVSTQPSSQKSDDEKKKTISGIIFLGVIVLILFGICSIQGGGDEINPNSQFAAHIYNVNNSTDCSYLREHWSEAFSHVQLDAPDATDYFQAVGDRLRKLGCD